jgi:hypothetical protein
MLHVACGDFHTAAGTSDFTCFTGTKVQILTQLPCMLRVGIILPSCSFSVGLCVQVRSVSALLVQQYKY